MNISPFKIYFDKQEKNYYLAPDSNIMDPESIIFVKLKKKLVKFSLIMQMIKNKIIISLGDVHFSVEVDPK